MEFQIGMRFFQVLKDLRIREIELVEIIVWGDVKTAYRLHFLPVSRKGKELWDDTYTHGSLGINEKNENGVLLGANVFTTVEKAHAFALDRAGRNVRCKHLDLAKARSSLTKAEAALRDVRKAAQASGMTAQEVLNHPS